MTLQRTEVAVKAPEYVFGHHALLTVVAEVVEEGKLGSRVQNSKLSLRTLQFHREISLP